VFVQISWSLLPRKRYGDLSVVLISPLLKAIQMVYYTGNYTTYVRTKGENEVNQMKAYNKQQEEIAHIKK